MEQGKQREFINKIKACRRKYNLAGFLDKSVSALCIGAVAGLVFQAAAFLTPVYYVNLYTAAALILSLIAAAAAACIRRFGMEQAALKIDGFGFGERVITAYENLGKEGTFIDLQREDAIRQLDMHGDKIHIRIMPSWKKTASFSVLMIMLIGLAVTPSAVKERAEELHKIRETARDKQEEIEENIKELGQLSQEELTLEQQAAIQEMIESLQSSMSEYQQAVSAEALNAATEKLNYKYNDMSGKLSELAQSLQSGAEVSEVNERALEAMAKKMSRMSGMDSAGSLASNQGQGDKNGDSGSGQEDGDGQGNGQEDGNGQGDGQGNGQGNGDGQGNGQGNGNGQGDGNRQGGSQGNNGTGRGTGSSDTPHDYVSVPNDIADSDNLTGSSVDHDASEFFRAPNGLSWEGEHISHEAVIKDYTQNAYEGIASGKYPSGMEGVIKEYFSSFN